MTSSLVGSEMCIRDRRSTNPTDPLHIIPPGMPPFADPPTAPPIPSAEEAVSYTHLTLPTICSV
eukprot:108079-Prorocentrum_lima.AAC.1